MEMGSPGGPSMTLPGVADTANDKLFMLQIVEDDIFFMIQLIGTGAEQRLAASNLSHGGRYPRHQDFGC